MRLSALLSKTRDAAITGKLEPFKTTSQFDGTAQNVRWMSRQARQTAVEGRAFRRWLSLEVPYGPGFSPAACLRGFASSLCVELKYARISEQMSPGTKIGRYQIERELGHGGMGTVFLAEDPMIGRRVALKVIRLDDSGSADQQRLLAQSFLKESRLAGVLHHPGVVGVFDAGRQDNLAYIVMEFVDGQTLEAVLRSKPRPEIANLLGICRQAATVLDYAHAHGVIHRDIKPTNMLVQRDGAVKICDFGIAKVMQSTEFALTQTGMSLGTPEYMSPEQVLGQPLGGRSDQWSLAVVAYQMVTDVKPFHSDNFTQVLAQIMTLDPEPACKLNPALPTGVDAVFARALSKKPPDRFPNCCEFVEALEWACAAVPAPARAPVALPEAVLSKTPIGEPAQKASSRRLVAIAALGLAILSAVAALRLFRHTAPASVETAPSPVSPKAAPADLPRPVRARIAAAPQAKLAAPGKPAPESHPVRLVTVPAGVAVTIDNSPDSVCQSPCSTDLAAGQHTIQAKKEGYYPLVRSFQVDGQQTDVSFTLIEITGSVIVETVPAGASISVNGTPRTETTPASIRLPVGQYKVSLTKEGFEPFDYDVTVRGDEIYRSKATLAKSSH